jgi:hypothetical protein
VNNVFNSRKQGLTSVVHIRDVRVNMFWCEGWAVWAAMEAMSGCENEKNAELGVNGLSVTKF